MPKQDLSGDVVGKPLDRVDGKLKVTGGAKYAGEFAVPNIAFGVLVDSEIAKGSVRSMDTGLAKQAAGVLAVLTQADLNELPKPGISPGSTGHPLLVDEVAYSGQHLAVVVAETLEQGEYAASLIKIEYDKEKPEVLMDDSRLGEAFTLQGGRMRESKRGDVDAAFAQASTKVDQVYRTPVEHHNPMEPHATIAIWSPDGKLLAYDATQGVTGSARNLANIFGLTAENVHVIDPFVGGGFGCKGQAWPHQPLAALAAKVVNRPVKVVITRRQMFTNNGHRAETRQALKLGADSGGKLTALKGDMVNHTSQNVNFLEPTGSLPVLLYSCPNLDVDYKLIKADVPAPTYMRAPGESSGSWGLETAMDELAVALSIDPVNLRLRNYADRDEDKNKPWSSKHLRECYEQAAAAFGWSKRNPAVGSMKNGRMLVGYGMATASYPANFGACSAKARIMANGTAIVECGTQDLGTGTYTILTQIAADAMGIEPSKIEVRIADTHLPQAPGSGGSTSATSAGSAVMQAGRAVRNSVLALTTGDQRSPFFNLVAEDVESTGGHLISRKDPSKSMSYHEILAKYGKPFVEESVSVRQRSTDAQEYSYQGFGAQFCEVNVDPDLGSIRVVRWTGAFAIGKILNEKTLTSQLQGGIVFGIGMGLLEETVPDPRYGRYLNTNLAEYHVPVNKDVPPIEIILIPEEDPYVSLLGAKGAGEIGITGAAAAIGNAIYHATGKRIRELPITLDKIM